MSEGLERREVSAVGVTKLDRMNRGSLHLSLPVGASSWLAARPHAVAGRIDGARVAHVAALQPFAQGV